MLCMWHLQLFLKKNKNEIAETLICIVQEQLYVKAHKYFQFLKRNVFQIST